MRAPRVILFSGHMIDAPDRTTPRFPPSLEDKVAAAIRRKLDELNAGSDDIGISSAACGSDILFAEAALDRGVRLRIYLPFDEGTFLERSVAFAGSDWLERYDAVLSRSRVAIAQPEIDSTRAGGDPYDRTNRWMLAEAQLSAGDAVDFVCVWDGDTADGPGGTKHMIAAVRKTTAAVHWIDIRTL